MVPDYSNSQSLLGKVKIYGLRKNFNNYSVQPDRQMVPTATSSVIKLYNDRTLALDRLFYQDHPPNIQGPFQQSLSSYFNKGITPYICGAFGECNDNIDNLLMFCATQATATREGIHLSPYDINDTNDTSPNPSLTTRNILLYEFRTTVGCSALRANINHKLHRLCFIRPSHQVAVATAAAPKHKKFSHFQSSFHSWFSSTGDSGVYDEYVLPFLQSYLRPT